MALSATIPPGEVDAICRIVKDSVQELASVNKPNISYHVQELKLPVKGLYMKYMYIQLLGCIIYILSGWEYISIILLPSIS